MGKRVHTMDYFRKLAEAKGGKCLSKSYISTNKKLKWMCAEGYIWHTRPSHIMDGRWCPHCDGQAPLTIKDLQATAKKKGGKCLSKKYLGNKVKLKWMCVEGHIWSATPGNVRSGTWCAKCEGIQKLTIPEIKKIAESRGGKLLSKVYVNAHKELKWKCAEGHIWNAPYTRIQTGQWCNRCNFYYSEELCRTTFEQLFNKVFNKDRPNWLINERGNQMELDGYCKDLRIAFEYQGEQHYKITSYIKTKKYLDQRQNDDRHKYKLCREHGVRLFVINYKHDLLKLPDLIKQKSKLLGVDANKINFKKKINFNKVYKHKTNIKRMQELSKKMGGRCVSKNYINMMTKLKWECKNKHTWKSLPMSIVKGHWCPDCARGTLTIQEMHKIAESKDGKCLSNIYKNNHTKLKWMCSRKHIWKALPSNIKSGRWCRKCYIIRKTLN